MPYLRIFDGQQKSSEYELTKPEVVIGRNKDAVDILVDDPSVSLRHAVIKPYQELHMIEDAESRTGILVNGHPMPCSQLAHGVTIQVGPCVMEYRTDDQAKNEAQETGNPLMQNIRKKFSLLPQGVTLRFRVIPGKAEQLFKTGDTLDFGDGGVLLPMRQPLKRGQCLEVEITAKNGVPRSYAGEVLEILEDHATPEMCIKLHFVGKRKHAELTRDAGDWVHAWPLDA